MSNIELANVNSVQLALQKNVNAFKSLLPKEISPQKMARLALNQLRKNPRLMNCTLDSFVGAVMQSAELGLELDGRNYACIIPYGKYVTFQPMYQGILKMFYNAVPNGRLIPGVVKEKDTFWFDLLSIERPKHTFDINIQDRGEAILYYCLVDLPDGSFRFEVITKQEVEAHRNQYSKSYNSNQRKKVKGEFYEADGWENNFDGMALKTVILKILKYLPKATNRELLERVVSVDGKIIKGYQYDEVNNQVDIDVEFPTVEISPESKDISDDAKAKLVNSVKRVNAAIDAIETADANELPINGNELFELEMEKKKVDAENWVGILTTEIKERGVTLSQLEKANNVNIKDNNMMAKKILEVPGMLNIYIEKAKEVK